MRRWIVIGTALFVMLAGTSWALEDTPDNRSRQADRYIAATPPREMILDAAERISHNIPREQRQQFKDLMTKHLDIPALENAMRQAMTRHFSADELKALADFYGSSVGKSAMKKLGVYMADVMPVIQKELMRAQAKADLELNMPTTKRKAHEQPQ